MVLEYLVEPSHRYISTFACTVQPAGRFPGSWGEGTRKAVLAPEGKHGPYSEKRDPSWTHYLEVCTEGHTLGSVYITKLESNGPNYHNAKLRRMTRVWRP